MEPGLGHEFRLFRMWFGPGFERPWGGQRVRFPMKNAIVWAQSGVGHDVPEGAIVSGSPAFDSRDWLRASATYSRLPEMLRTIRALERRIAQLEKG